MGYLKVFEMGGKELLERESLSVQEKMMLCKVEGNIITTLGEEKDHICPSFDPSIACLQLNPEIRGP